jgi:hypothetical protein
MFPVIFYKLNEVDHTEIMSRKAHILYSSWNVNFNQYHLLKLKTTNCYSTKGFEYGNFLNFCTQNLSTQLKEILSPKILLQIILYEILQDTHL